MKRYFCAHLALVAGMVLAPVAMAADTQSAADQAVFVGDADVIDATVNDAGDVTAAAVLKELDENVELAQFSSGLGVGAGLGGGGGALPLGAASGCSGQWFLGADYLNVRASFSQAHSFLTTDFTSTPPSFVYNQFEFDYEPNYRVYGGYRVCDCGCEVRFTYTNIDSGSSFASPENPSDGSMQFNAPFEVITAGPGDSVNGTASVSIDDYDLGFSRTIPLGSPLGACGCGDCCDPCGCWCPAWDITWTGAVRFTDVETSQAFASNIVSTSAPGLNRTAQANTSFQGLGLRTGLLGRRYFGREGIASLYLKGDISLLLGDVENTAVGTAFARHAITTTQIVPVTELEVGGTVFVTKCASISGGYLLAAFHDLGSRPEYDFGTLGVQLESWDDANILGIDGWFVRAEVTY